MCPRILRFAKYLLSDRPPGFAYDPRVIRATEIYYIVFGALTLLGGIVGYLKAKSWPSLLAGVLFGIALVGAGLLMIYGATDPNYLMPGKILGLLATVGLGGWFIPKVMMNRAAPHVIAMAVLSAIGMILTLIVFGTK